VDVTQMGAHGLTCAVGVGVGDRLHDVVVLGAIPEVKSGLKVRFLSPPQMGCRRLSIRRWLTPMSTALWVANTKLWCVGCGVTWDGAPSHDERPNRERRVRSPQPRRDHDLPVDVGARTASAA
jgi:hypothetical protein